MSLYVTISMFQMSNQPFSCEAKIRYNVINTFFTKNKNLDYFGVNFNSLGYWEMYSYCPAYTLLCWCSYVVKETSLQKLKEKYEEMRERFIQLEVSFSNAPRSLDAVCFTCAPQNLCAYCFL